MEEGINLLLADGIVDGVIGRLKSGKEADVWLVQHSGEIVAAKIYKERETRSFRNNAAYKDGRQVRNSRTQRAIDKGSRFGQKAAEEAWKSAEADALYKLQAAGVRVPAPVMFYEGVLLMEVVVDPDGHPAPRLNDAVLTAEQAGAMYRDLRSQVVKMLCADIIHGDLSPFNVLLAWNGPVIIDFPQVVGAAHNNEARRFFTRDLENLRLFFAGFDPSLKLLGGDVQEIWRAYEKRELTPDFVTSERPQAERPPEQERRGPQQGGNQKREGRREFGGQQNPQGRPGGPRDGRRNGPRPQNGAPQQSQGAPHSNGGQGRPQNGAQQQSQGAPHRNGGQGRPQNGAPQQSQQSQGAPNRNGGQGRPQNGAQQQSQQSQGAPNRDGGQGRTQGRNAFRPNGRDQGERNAQQSQQGAPRQNESGRGGQAQQQRPRQQRNGPPSNGPIIERINRPASSGPIVERVNRPPSSSSGSNPRPFSPNRPPRRGP